MNWMNWLRIVLQLAPIVVAGVEKVAGDNASGATKKKMAMDALQIATTGAEQVDPNDTEIVQAASNVTGLIIDSTVNDKKADVTSQVIEHHVTKFNSDGVFVKAPPATGAPIPDPAAPATHLDGPGIHNETPR